MRNLFKRWFKRSPKPIMMPNGQPFLVRRGTETYRNAEGNEVTVSVFGDGSADERRE